MAKKRKKSEDISLLSVKGVQKLFFGSKRRGGITITMVCAVVIGLSKAVPIVWGWTLQSRAIAENVLTQDIQDEVSEVKEKVEVVERNVQQIDHNHSTKMDFMMREMQIQREMGHRQWALLRDFADMGPPPDPESLVPTLVPTKEPVSTVVVERPPSE